MTELIAIETSKLWICIKGDLVNNQINNEENSNLRIESSGEIKISHAFEAEKTVENIYKSMTKPIFFENKSYEIVVELKEEKDYGALEFFHQSLNIRNKISKTGKRGQLYSGIINFKSEIGLSEFVLYIGGIEDIRFCIEVFPSKLDYKKDYENILKDINKELNGIVYDFAKKTYMNTSLGKLGGNTDNEFYSIFKQVYKRFIKSLNIIVKNPHHTLQKESRIVEFDRLKKSSKDTVNWLLKNQKHMGMVDGDIRISKALEVRKTQTNDTYENRFLKHVLKSIVLRLENIQKNYSSLERIQDDHIKKEIRSKIREIEIILKNSFLKNVGDYNGNESFSMVLRMGAGYKDIYKHSIMLNRILILKNDIFKMSMKDMANLYEIWCFIKINSILSRKYIVRKNNFIKFQNRGLYINLRKGVKSYIDYEDEITGDRITIAYNRGSNTETIAQRPDNVLSIKKEGKEEYNYIFDAKYKIDMAESGSGYKNKYHAPGPKEDDINTMHRYRDAITSDSKNVMKRDTFGAYVLFPYSNEEEYKNHKFYKSIERVNIGGIPFLPTSTKLMEMFLDELIGESSYTAYERRVDSKGEENYFKPEYYKVKNVLVGIVNTKEQLDVSLSDGFYHIPKDKVNIEKNHIEYIALYQKASEFKRDSGIRYFGKIESREILKRKEITQLAHKNNKAELDYYKFNVENWERLKRPIGVKESRIFVNIYTTKYLLENATKTNELLVRDGAEFRLWYELKRRYKEKLELVLNKNKKSSIEHISVNQSKIYIDKEILRINAYNNEYKISKEEFMKSPGKISKVVIERLEGK